MYFLQVALRMLALLVLLCWMATEAGGAGRCPAVSPCHCTSLGFTNEQALDIDCRQRDLTEVPNFISLLGYQLYQIDLSENSITWLHNHSFVDLEFVQIPSYNTPRIDLSYNILRRIDSAAFAGIMAVDLTLVFINSSLQELPVDALAHVENVTFLHLMDNEIGALPDAAFAGLSKLQAINLSGNKVVNMSKAAFHGLENTLEVLNLNDMDLGYFPGPVLRPLRKLRRLELDGNNMIELQPRMFQGFHTHYQAFSLSLQYNELTNIPTNAFLRYNFTLRDLDLSNNNLTSIDFLARPCGSALVPSSHLDVVYNPIHCDCGTLTTLHRLPYTIHGRCVSPWNYADLPFGTDNGELPYRYRTLAAYECSHMYVNGSLYIPPRPCAETTYHVLATRDLAHTSFRVHGTLLVMVSLLHSILNTLVLLSWRLL